MPFVLYAERYPFRDGEARTRSKIGTIFDSFSPRTNSHNSIYSISPELATAKYSLAKPECSFLPEAKLMLLSDDPSYRNVAENKAQFMIESSL